jgi:signal peptide peptidase SppA
MTLLAHIADRVGNRPLMILPQKLAIIASVLDGRIGIESAGLVAKVGAMPAATRSSPGPKHSQYFTRRGRGVAVIPVIGSLVNRGSFIDTMSGLTSYEWLRTAINAAIADDDVSSVVFDFDSAGGEAIGAFEVAEFVRQAAKIKPIGSSISGLCCSAAFLIASATSRIMISTSSMAGSIGVVFCHFDRSKQVEKAGVQPTFVFAGARKIDANPFQELSEDVRDDIQREIDFYYALFVETVAAGRTNLSPDDIRATEARTYIGAEAVRVGLADAVGSLADLVGEFSSLDTKVRNQKLGKYEMTERLYGSASAIHQRVQDAHLAGVRAGMAAALSGRTAS